MNYTLELDIRQLERMLKGVYRQLRREQLAKNIIERSHAQTASRRAALKLFDLWSEVKTHLDDQTNKMCLSVFRQIGTRDNIEGLAEL